MIAAAGLVVVKLDLEGIAVVAVLGYRGQGGVALGADGHILVAFPIDDQMAGHVLLIGAGGQKAVPVLHNDVQSMHPGGIKEAVFVADNPLRCDPPGSPRAHVSAGDQQQGGQYKAADPVDAMVSEHGITPDNRRCS